MRVCDTAKQDLERALGRRVVHDVVSAWRARRSRRRCADLRSPRRTESTAQAESSEGTALDEDCE